jgi:hypothetical protein
MVQGTAQALAAQSGIQTAQATPLSTSTATPPAMPTPSTPGMLEVTYAANLHLGNPYGPVDDPEQAIQPNTVVIPAGAEKSGPYGLMYKEVSVNGKTGWIVSNLLEPVPPKNAQPLVEDPSKKVVIDPKFSAGLQSVEFLNINKASLEANNKIESSASPDLALTNLCGEFAVAYITNQPIVNVLSDWVKKGQPPKNAPSVPVNPKETLLSTSTKGETSVYDLESMLDVYGRSYTPLINRNTADWTSIFQDQAVPGKPLIFTPEKIQAQLDRGQVLIIGVGIDGKGNIVITQSYDPTKSVPHWIIVEKVQPESATEGQVLIYNPYTNSEEPITFSDLTAGYKNFQGSDMPDGLFVSTSPSVSQIDNYPMFAKANYIIPNNVSSHNPQNKGTTTAAREELNKVTTYVQQKVVQPIQKALNDGASTFQKNIVQPVQKALNDGASSVKKNIIQPAQKALKKVTTTVQQKVVQPAQKALNQVNSVVQQKVIQPAKNFLNSLVSTVKNIGKPASTPKSTPSTPVQKTSASVTKNQTSGRTNRRS